MSDYIVITTKPKQIVGQIPKSIEPWLYKPKSKRTCFETIICANARGRARSHIGLFRSKIFLIADPKIDPRITEYQAGSVVGQHIISKPFSELVELHKLTTQNYAHAAIVQSRDDVCWVAPATLFDNDTLEWAVNSFGCFCFAVARYGFLSFGHFLILFGCPLPPKLFFIWGRRTFTIILLKLPLQL